MMIVRNMMGESHSYFAFFWDTMKKIHLCLLMNCVDETMKCFVLMKILGEQYIKVCPIFVDH